MDDEFVAFGNGAVGEWKISDNGQVVNITGGGDCGYVGPKRMQEDGFCGPAGGWHLKLKRIVDQVWFCATYKTGCCCCLYVALTHFLIIIINRIYILLGSCLFSVLPRTRFVLSTTLGGCLYMS